MRRQLLKNIPLPTEQVVVLLMKVQWGKYPILERPATRKDVMKTQYSWGAGHEALGVEVWLVDHGHVGL